LKTVIANDLFLSLTALQGRTKLGADQWFGGRCFDITFGIFETFLDSAARYNQDSDPGSRLCSTALKARGYWPILPPFYRMWKIDRLVQTEAQLKPGASIFGARFDELFNKLDQTH
jgi:hypothetical protein